MACQSRCLGGCGRCLRPSAFSSRRLALLSALPIFFWLHIYCPGCGGTRALAALLHGRLNEAMHWNALVVIFLPFAAAFLAVTYGRSMKATPFLWPTIPHSLLKLFLGLIVLFTVFRNLAPQ